MFYIIFDDITIIAVLRIPVPGDMSIGIISGITGKKQVENWYLTVSRLMSVRYV
jgi:hypothetical protein